jgi:hypothetical protein
MSWAQLIKKLQLERYTLPPAHESDTKARQASRRSVLVREVHAFNKDHRGDRFNGTHR